MTDFPRDQRWSGTESDDRPWEQFESTMEYNGRHDGCRLCEGDEFEAGFIALRIRRTYGDGWGDHDYEGLCEELAEQFGLEVSPEALAEHYNHHVSHRQRPRQGQ